MGMGGRGREGLHSSWSKERGIRSGTQGIKGDLRYGQVYNQGPPSQTLPIPPISLLNRFSLLSHQPAWHPNNIEHAGGLLYLYCLASLLPHFYSFYIVQLWYDILSTHHLPSGDLTTDFPSPMANNSITQAIYHISCCLKCALSFYRYLSHATEKPR